MYVIKTITNPYFSKFKIKAFKDYSKLFNK